MALGTIQVALLAAETDGSVVLPEPPFGLSMTIEGGAEPVVYLFEDPDPGHFSKTSDDGDVLLSITTRTFAVPLEPGDYTITEIQVWSDVFGVVDDELGIPESRPLPQVPASGGETGVVRPHFTVVEGEPCTFIGEITSLTTRLPPGDSVEMMSMAQEYAGGAPATLSMDPEGALMSGQMGLNLLDEVIDPEYLSGYSWWLDGEQVDDTLGVTREASFEPE
jgi:hypothetical protein